LTTALITGIAGQDGSYLAELLLQKGYVVVGLDHPKSTVTYEYLKPIREKIYLREGDLCDQQSLEAVLEECRPSEVYNLAAISFPPISWKKPELTGQITALGVVRLLEAIRKIVPKAHFYQASSSEMFGKVTSAPQNENTPFHPRNPYGTAKVYAHWVTANYREQYGMFSVSGILFNHEGPRRGLEYVTRKVTHAAARIKLGLDKRLPLGNLEARRDWGFAGDYVRAMWMMLQHRQPEDFVVGTGKTHSVRELCQAAFGSVGLDYREFVVQEQALYRAEGEIPLVADPRKANQVLGWMPSVSFEQMIAMMVREDLKTLWGE